MTTHEYWVKHKQELVEKHKEWRHKNPDKINGWKRKYYILNHAKLRKYHKRYNERSRIKMVLTRPILRRKVMNIIGKGIIECVNCKCDMFEALEINHKKGGGNKEQILNYGGDSRRYYRAIVNGERKTDDLEITCRLCNSLHYLELKLGKLPFTVTWMGTRTGV